MIAPAAIENGADSERILLLAPAGRDAVLLSEQLTRRGFHVAACKDIAALCEEMRAGAGTLFVAEEALIPRTTPTLIEHLKNQPPWSDLPVIIMTEARDSLTPSRRLEPLFGASGNVTLLERPIRLLTLMSVVASSLKSRRRQYEVRHLLEETRSAVHQRDQFLAMLGHELRNPLAAMVNATALLCMSGGKDEELLNEQIQVLIRQSAHTARLVDDLLDVARITSGKVALDLQLLDLRDVSSHALQTLRSTLGKQQHEIVFETPGVNVLVQGDPVRLEQIILNLLTNAVKYTPAGGKISLHVQDGGEAVVRVIDSGEGIPEGMREHIFEPFAQMTQTLARSRGGLGMGLAVVRSLVEMHGGRVCAHSEGSGRGSEFSVHLPLATVPEKAEEPAKYRDQQHDGPCAILLVEDNPDSRRSLGKLLALRGHQVQTAASGPEGLEKAVQRPPDLVLLDIGLPGMDGFEVCRQLRQALGAQIYLIALTGYGQPEDRQRVLKAGFDLHLVKPVEPELLLQIIDERGCRAISG